jgi:effector-binding domain-containing protein
MTVHRGPYEGLGSAHQVIWDWCAANGREMAGPRWEIYGDWYEDQSQLETEVYYLLL